jgi:hypothetical protein
VKDKISIAHQRPRGAIIGGSEAALEIPRADQHGPRTVRSSEAPHSGGFKTVSAALKWQSVSTCRAQANIDLAANTGSKRSVETPQTGGFKKMKCGGANATCHVQSSWAVGPPINEGAKEKTSISHKRHRGKRSGETPQAGGFKNNVWRCKCNMPCPEQLDSGAANEFFVWRCNTQHAMSRAAGQWGHQ